MVHFAASRGFAVSCAGTPDSAGNYKVEFQPLGRDWLGDFPPALWVRARSCNMAVQRAVGALLLIYDDLAYSLQVTDRVPPAPASFAAQ